LVVISTPNQKILNFIYLFFAENKNVASPVSPLNNLLHHGRRRSYGIWIIASAAGPFNDAKMGGRWERS
jgi:hypothetical protein